MKLLTTTMKGLLLAGMTFGTTALFAQDAGFSTGAEEPAFALAALQGNFSWNNALYEIEEDATSATAEAGSVVYESPAASESYIAKMTEQAFTHEMILRNMDSLNSAYLLAAAVSASETSGMATANTAADGSHAMTAATKDNGTGSLRDEARRLMPNAEYAVVLGSFNIETNAVHYNEMMKDRGYKSEIVYSADRSKHRVLVVAESKKLAKIILDDVKQNTPMKDAWPLSLTQR